MLLPPREEGLDGPAQLVNTSDLPGFQLVSVGGDPVLNLIDFAAHHPDREPGLVDSRSPEQDRGIMKDVTVGFDGVFEQGGFFRVGLDSASEMLLFVLPSKFLQH